MALSGVTALQTAMATPFDRKSVSKSMDWTAQAIAGGAWISSWLSTGFPAAGAAPGSAGSMTARVCDRNTPGALGQNNAVSVELRAFLKTLSGYPSTAVPVPFMVVLCDRLADCSSFTGAVTTRQTTSLAAPTRYNAATDRIHAGIETYVSMSNATTVQGTIDYTNQNGTSGQVSPSTLTIAGGFAGAQVPTLFKPISLATPDVGFSTVDGLTLASSSLGATGNWGITLYKPLLPLLCVGGFDDANNFDPIERLGAYLPLIKTDACLFFLLQAPTVATYQIQGEVGFLTD